MSDVDNPFAEPMSMEQALDALETLDEQDNLADEEEPSQEADEEEALADDTEAEEELDADPEPEDVEESQLLTIEEYGEVRVSVAGNEMTLDELAQGHLRQSDYTRKSQQREEQYKSRMDELNAREQEINARSEQLSAQAANFEEPEPDWVKLAEEDPIGYVSKKANWDARQVAAAKAKAVTEANQQKALNAHRQETAAKAIEVMPEWADAKTFESGAAARKAVALSAGFSEQEFETVQDFRLAVLLEKAARYDAGQTKVKAAEKRINKAPKVVRPGAAKTPQETQAAKKASISKRLSKPMTSAQALDLIMGS